MRINIKIPGKKLINFLYESLLKKELDKKIDPRIRGIKNGRKKNKNVNIRNNKVIMLFEFY